MLVLARKKNESIVLLTTQGLVSIVVVEVRGDKVRLGIEAPKEMPVHRLEVWESIQKKGEERKEKRENANTNGA